jgi:transforming growth factor-beta-induced protein
VLAADVVKLTSAETANSIPVQIKVVDGEVFVNSSKVVITDVEASNGVIHVIDSVILPPKDIVSIAVENGSFTTLAALLKPPTLLKPCKEKAPLPSLPRPTKRLPNFRRHYRSFASRYSRSQRYPALPCC